MMVKKAKNSLPIHAPNDASKAYGARIASGATIHIELDYTLRRLGPKYI